MRFLQYIGVDYSGARTADSGQAGLRVYACDGVGMPEEVLSPRCTGTQRRHWTRNDVCGFLEESISARGPVIIGIDHGLSFPEAYFERYGLKDWRAFLEDFVTHWPLHEAGVTVDGIRAAGPARTGDPRELRLCEQWTTGAKSVFRFDVQGQVGKSTHAGLAQVWKLRRACGDALHVWPFDGWEIPLGKSALVEVYPALLSRRYAREDRTGDQHDAYAVSRWLAECDRLGRLDHYFCPPLCASEYRTACLEGWILGVC